jgi:hypothetical protein
MLQSVSAGALGTFTEGLLEIAVSRQIFSGPIADWTTGVRSRQRQRIFPTASVSSSEAHRASCTMGTGGPFPGGKAWPERDADHSPHLLPRS